MGDEKDVREADMAYAAFGFPFLSHEFMGAARESLIPLPPSKGGERR